jgi:prolyl-tRNA synthetase
MLLSQLFTKTSKDVASDADSINADLLTRAGFIHKTMAGAYSFLPLGLKVLKKIEGIIREEMDAIGAQELLLSALSPKESWVKTDRWDSFDALFKVSAHGDAEYGLNPTHEEVIVPVAKAFVSSYKDLPFGAYQIQTKFRNEPRAKSGILRGREFGMKDLYSFNKDEKCLDEYYEKVADAYWKIFERLGLAEKTYYTYATGGSFSEFSHEYQVLLPQGEDTIYVSEDAQMQGKRIAINQEIYEEGKTKCPVTGGTTFREEKASEAANIFKLGTKFSGPFKLNFTDSEGKLHPIVMGCYGMGTTRVMGIIAEFFADDSGLNWPAQLAPADEYVVPVAKSQDDESFKKAMAYAKGKDVLFDDRLDLSVGERLADADLIGLPTRIVISPKTLENGQMEVKDRASGEVKMEAL